MKILHSSIEKIKQHPWIAFEVVVCILMMAWPALYFKRVIQFPFPLEYRDAASVLTAEALSQGINPYVIESFPQQMYLYGFLYPVMIAPFIGFVENPMIIPRLINLVFLVFSAITLSAILRKRGVSWGGVFTGVLVFVYAMCLVQTLNGARPDIPAVFFMLAGIHTALETDFRPAGLFALLVSAIIILLLKQYLLLPIVILGIYIFLFRSKSLAIQLAVLGLALLFGSLALATAVYPLYLQYSILHHWQNTYLLRDHMVIQFSYFIEWNFALVLALLYAFHRRYLQNNTSTRDLRVSFLRFNKPLLEGIKVDPYDFLVMSILFLLFVSMARHTGNTHIYFIELLLPFCLISALPAVESKYSQSWRHAAVMGAIAFSILPYGLASNVDFSRLVENYRALAKRISYCGTLYGSPETALMERAEDKPTIYDNGMSEYAWTVIAPEDDSLLLFLFGSNAEGLRIRNNEWQEEIAAKVEGRKFDCIVVSHTTTLLAGVDIRQYYTHNRYFPEILNLDIVLWTPTTDQD